MIAVDIAVIISQPSLRVHLKPKPAKPRAHDRILLLVSGILINTQLQLGARCGSAWANRFNGLGSGGMLLGKWEACVRFHLEHYISLCESNVYE